MQDKFYSKRIRKDELGKVQEVFNKTRNVQVKKDFFVNKFISNCKKEFISVMFFDEDMPISHCAAIPYDFSNSKENGNDLIGAQVIDAVTLQSHQRKGLFNATNHEIEKIAEDENIDLLFRFPSLINYQRVINNFKFTKTENFQTFEFKFKVLFPFLKLFQKFEWGFLSRAYFKMISFITFSDKKIIANSLASQGFYHIPHSIGYFEHKKYSENYRISIFGDDYWLKHGDGIDIGDFNIKSDKKFMKKLKWFCFFFGIHRICFNVSQGTKEFELLSSFKEPSEGTAICIKALGDKPIDIFRFKFTYADSDTF